MERFGLGSTWVRLLSMCRFPNVTFEVRSLKKFGHQCGEESCIRSARSVKWICELFVTD